MSGGRSNRTWTSVPPVKSMSYRSPFVASEPSPTIMTSSEIA